MLGTCVFATFESLISISTFNSTINYFSIYSSPDQYDYQPVSIERRLKFLNIEHNIWDASQV